MLNSCSSDGQSRSPCGLSVAILKNLGACRRQTPRGLGVGCLKGALPTANAEVRGPAMFEGCRFAGPLPRRPFPAWPTLSCLVGVRRWHPPPPPPKKDNIRKYAFSRFSELGSRVVFPKMLPTSSPKSAGSEPCYSGSPRTHRCH